MVGTSLFPEAPLVSPPLVFYSVKLSPVLNSCPPVLEDPLWGVLAILIGREAVFQPSLAGTTILPVEQGRWEFFFFSDHQQPKTSYPSLHCSGFSDHTACFLSESSLLCTYCVAGKLCFCQACSSFVSKLDFWPGHLSSRSIRLFYRVTSSHAFKNWGRQCELFRSQVCAPHNMIFDHIESPNPETRQSPLFWL